MRDLTPGGGGGRGGRAMPSAEGARPATGEAAATSTDDVARVITQQAAVADFGRFVMESWNIAGSIERAVDIVAGVLQVPVAAVLQVLDSGRAAVVHSRGPVATALGEQSPLSLDGVTPRARATTPVMVEPRTEPGVDRPRSADVVRGPHSLSVPVPVGGRSWGRLVAADEAPRRFSGTEVAFVLSVANVLAAALERERVESGRAAVAAFGRFALQSREITATMDQALEVVTRVLGMPVGVVVATVGAPGQPGRMAVMRTTGPIGMQPGLEYDLGDNLPDAYFTHEPLIIEDWRNDRTFTAFRAEHVSHLVASVSVSVLVEGRLWGRLIAADTGPRRFSASEIDIISSVADMLAKALERGNRSRRRTPRWQPSAGPPWPPGTSRRRSNGPSTS
ncbi:MAG TPA: GAF domain-containing protein [Kineosporiaceae bacterium]|nr:GAF domain-containing protein [Kineosporiaceae bacterium]